MTSRRTAWLIFAALLIVGCSSATESPTVAMSEGEPLAASAGIDVIPPGRYVADIPTGVAAAPGEWTMEVGADGEVTWTHPEGTIFSPGALVEVTSSEIVLAPDPACPDQGDPTEGTYEWSWDGNSLHFTVASDSCQGRIDTFTSAPWVPVP